MGYIEDDSLTHTFPPGASESRRAQVSVMVWHRKNGLVLCVGVGEGSLQLLLKEESPFPTVQVEVISNVKGGKKWGK